MRASPKFGTATFTNGITHSAVNITCKTGYELVNKTMSSRTCQPTGEWSGDGGNFCQPVSCLDQINLPANSTFESGRKPADPRFGTKVNFECKEGFVKAGGGKQVQCGLNGRWHWACWKAVLSALNLYGSENKPGRRLIWRRKKESVRHIVTNILLVQTRISTGGTNVSYLQSRWKLEFASPILWVLKRLEMLLEHDSWVNESFRR